ncbi:hypothetical protein PHYPSEUDO_006447 [Phytophthora pseudosyringae]|uniref:Reverse transcriptase n=1 Tax=Phytophthora pseudosyringae TaxID=221518 RepID=A0A8T1VJ73_9STRA|nr:hypothetical protein PHYPSEUDO_006447 [Phytophthora pseudosyringae]
MRMLVLNFPQLLRRGTHAGSIRYLTGATDHTPLRRSITADWRVVKPSVDDDGEMAATRVHSHRELEHYMQQEVGETTTVKYVHPRLVRLVCLWAGRRRWKVSRKLFKAQINKRERTQGMGVGAKAQVKWCRHSSAAAIGLGQLRWHKLRRVVGLTPWGEQLIYRLKHHALSAYNPVSAGFHCPHPECVRRGRVDLYHIFWECPAAVRLRRVMTLR